MNEDWGERWWVVVSGQKIEWSSSDEKSIL